MNSISFKSIREEKVELAGESFKNKVSLDFLSNEDGINSLKTIVLEGEGSVKTVVNV